MSPPVRAIEMNVALNWTTIATAVLALAGGAVSGGFAAYSQLSRAQEEFSIERAKMFQGLMESLKTKETARMALLILWQLYPESRDQKIIVAAAIESGHPDLIETIIGFDDELKQLAGILHAKAVTSGADAKGSALQTLIKVDPLKAAETMITFIENDIRLKEAGFVNNPMTFELTQLARSDPKVAEKMRSRKDESGETLLIFEYLLYTIGSESKFVNRIVDGYKTKENLQLVNDYLSSGNFKQNDSSRVFESARGFVLETMRGNKSKYDFDLRGALVGLRNNSFREQLVPGKNEELIETLYATIVDSEKSDRLRAKSLILLRKISPRKSLIAIANILSAGKSNPYLVSQIKEQIDTRLIAQYEKENPGLKGPQHCSNVEASNCVNQTASWADWYKEVSIQ